MSDASARRVMQRCPSCGAKVEVDAASCPMCGHEFGTTMPNKAVAYDPPGRRRAVQPVADAAAETPQPEPAALPKPGPSRLRSALRRLPWGVFGTLLVLGAIGIAIAIALNNQAIADRFLPAQPTPRITVQFLSTQPPPVTPSPVAIQLPTAPPTVAPTHTPVPPRIHTVEAGEVCSTIAEKYEIGLSVLIAANNLNQECNLRVGDRLRIPPPGSTAASQATAVASATPTRVVVATPTVRIGFAEPVPLGPLDGAVYTSTADAVALEWLTVGLLGDNEWYVVTVQPENQNSVPIFETKATSLKLTPAILGDQPQRKVTWWVQVRRLVSTTPAGQRNYEDRSTPSAPRSFIWQRAIVPTPRP